MSDIDDIASISAARLSRGSVETPSTKVVTASTDSVDFLHPIVSSDSLSLEAFVTWTGRSSMEIFVKVVKENLDSGIRTIAATAFLTFVALGENIELPGVVPETEEEKKLHETAPIRAEMRRLRREENKKLSSYLTVNYPWD